MTIRETLAEGGAALKAAGIETFSLDASLLLAGVTGLSRASLLARGEQPLADKIVGQFRELIARRLSGLSVAYIVGRKEFYGLEFTVTDDVLVPRPDTETLVEAAIHIFRQADSAEDRPRRVLDLCTGSGAVAIALKHELPELDMWAADMSQAALDVAQANAARLLPAHGTPIHFRAGDGFAALTPAGENFSQKQNQLFSLIVSNPPYIPSWEIDGLAPEVRREPRLALDGGADGLDIIRAIIAGAPGFLYPGGVLLLEADPRQMDDIAALLERSGFYDTRTYPDLAGRPRVIGGVIQ
jgi:release factor glutamine methyltransferase